MPEVWICLIAQVIPLWAIASRPLGGLALDNRWLGLMLSASAAVAMVYSTLLMARVLKVCNSDFLLLLTSLLLPPSSCSLVPTPCFLRLTSYFLLARVLQALGPRCTMIVAGSVQACTPCFLLCLLPTSFHPTSCTLASCILHPTDYASLASAAMQTACTITLPHLTRAPFWALVLINAVFEVASSHGLLLLSPSLTIPRLLAPLA